MRTIWLAKSAGSASLDPVNPVKIGLFAVCILAVWVYAAIRPRFGPGPKTTS
jgi:hypothetical protein